MLALLQLLFERQVEVEAFEGRQRLLLVSGGAADVLDLQTSPLGVASATEFDVVVPCFRLGAIGVGCLQQVFSESALEVECAVSEVCRGAGSCEAKALNWEVGHPPEERSVCFDALG